MKRLLIILGLTSFACTGASAATFLRCEYAFQNVMDPNATLGIFDRAEFQCTNAKGEDFQLNMRGIGPGLELDYLSEVLVVCPTVRKSRLTKRPFYGIKLSAALGLGAELTLMSNKHLGVCIISGVKIGAGAAVTVDKVWFEQL